jgi:hypothetical protein
MMINLIQIQILIIMLQMRVVSEMMTNLSNHQNI